MGDAMMSSSFGTVPDEMIDGVEHTIFKFTDTNVFAGLHGASGPEGITDLYPTMVDKECLIDAQHEAAMALEKQKAEEEAAAAAALQAEIEAAELEAKKKAEMEAREANQANLSE